MVSLAVTNAMASLQTLPFGPAVTGTALYLLTQGPPSLQQPLLQRLHQFLTPTNVGRVITGLKWLFALGLVRNINSYLSSWAGNNFSLRSTKSDWVWDQEIAVVTGASSGFGALFAKDLSAKGIRIAAVDVNELPSDLESNPKVTFFKCDITDYDAVQKLGDDIRSSLGSPSILINNAGIGAGKPIMKTTPQFLHKIFGVNLFSHWYTVQAFLPDMLAKKKGHIVSIASMASFVATAGIIDYAATKSGALVFHEGLSSELRVVYKCPEIKTSVVHPIWADTPLIAEGKEQLKKAGQLIISPQTVSDAVVEQVLAVRGGQIILSGGLGPLLSSLRGFPAWLQQILLRSSEMAAVEM